MLPVTDFSFAAAPTTQARWDTSRLPAAFAIVVIGSLLRALLLLYRDDGGPPAAAVASLLLSALTMVLFHVVALRLLPSRGALGALAFFATCPPYMAVSVAPLPLALPMTAYLAALGLFSSWIVGAPAAGGARDGRRADPRWRLLLALFCAGLAVLARPLLSRLGVPALGGAGWGLPEELYPVPFAALGIGFCLEWLLGALSGPRRALVLGAAIALLAAGGALNYVGLLGEGDEASAAFAPGPRHRLE